MRVLVRQRAIPRAVGGPMIRSVVRLVQRVLPPHLLTSGYHGEVFVLLRRPLGLLAKREFLTVFVRRGAKGEVFLRRSLHTTRHLVTTMQTEDNRVVLRRSDSSFYNVGRHNVRVPRLVALHHFFKKYTGRLSNVDERANLAQKRKGRVLRAISPVGVRPLTSEARTIDEVEVPHVLLTMGLCPIVIVPAHFFIYGVVLTRIVSMYPLNVDSFTRRPLLRRIRYDRNGYVMAAILRRRTIATNFFNYVRRAPTVNRARNNEGLRHRIATLLRNVGNGVDVDRPIHAGVGRICLLTFTRLTPRPFFQVILNFKATRLPWSVLYALCVLFPRVAGHFRLGTFRIRVSLGYGGTPISWSSGASPGCKSNETNWVGCIKSFRKLLCFSNGSGRGGQRTRSYL